MEESTILKLPNEITFDIFQYFDKKTLLNASLVCKAWSNLIGSSKVTMEKFKLCIDEKNLPSLCDHIKWKHRNVEIRFGNDPHGNKDFFKEAFEKIIEAFDFSCTRHLTIATMETADVPQIMTLLSQTPKLENLCIMLETCEAFEETESNYVTLPMLKFLTIYYQGAQNIVLKFLKADELAELKIMKIQRRFSQNQIITNFVKRCLKLKKLTLGGDAVHEMIESQQEFDFQLTSLGIGFTRSKYMNPMKINKFLASQPSSLIEMKLEMASVILDLEIIETILNIKSLLKFEVTTFCLPPENWFESGFMSNLSLPLKELTFSGAIIGHTKHVLKICPKLEVLRFVRTFSSAGNFLQSVVSFLSAHCPNLVRLSISCISGFEADKNLKLLKYLQTQFVTKDLMLLLASSPQIEVIDIGGFRGFGGLILQNNEREELLKMPTLTHLILRAENCKGDRVFVNNKHQNSTGKFKTLRMNFKPVDALKELKIIVSNLNWSIEKREDIKIKIYNYPEEGKGINAQLEAAIPKRDIK